MNIYSALTAPSSISPASGLRFGGVFETRSRQRQIGRLSSPLIGVGITAVLVANWGHPHSRNSIGTGEIAEPLVAGGRGFERLRRKHMHAREQVRDILISKRLKHWCAVARCPLLDPRCSTAKARKNYWYLWRRYPDIAARLGLGEFSVLEPF